MTRIQWLECWDELRERIQTGNTSWGRNQILDLMIDIERRKVREAEQLALAQKFADRPIPPENRDLLL